MSCQELQQEELEVLRSIYEGDECFKEVNSCTFHYKYGETGGSKSLLVELSWGEHYPEDCPRINMDTFYNNHLVHEVKEYIADEIQKQAEEFLGTAMTYTLFEWLKENLDMLLEQQPQMVVSQQSVEKFEVVTEEEKQDLNKKKEKKEHLTKSQKRKMFSRVNAKGEAPRGSDWVDVIKHLSQTGNQPKTEST